jgi:hypothetical protein
MHTFFSIQFSHTFLLAANLHANIGWKLMWSWEMQVRTTLDAVFVPSFLWLDRIQNPTQHHVQSIAVTGLRVESYGTGTQVR